MLVIMSPIDINKTDLNKAWTSKWKKDKNRSPQEKDIPINPKWDKVDKAINFFISVSKIEFTPA